MPPPWSVYLGSKVLVCRTLRLESQSSASFGMQPYPRSLDLVWPGFLHGMSCLSARAMNTGFPTVVWRLCLVLDLALAACWGAGLVCLCLDFAFSHSILAGLLSCVCSCTCSASTQPFLAGTCGACVRARVLALPRHLWLGCVVCVCVCGFEFWLHTGNPGWGVGVCVFVHALRLYLASPG